jgi:NitT/TauT family transport system substrate-binding protein
MSAYFLGAKKGGVLSLLLLLIGLLLSACGDPTATTVSTTATTTSATTTAAVTTSATSVVTAATTTATTTSATTTAATSGNLETIKVAHTPSVLFAPLYVAIENGYFSEQGLKVELTQVQAGQDAIALAGQGQLDVVVAGLSAATFNAVNRGIDIKVVASMAYQPKTGTPTALMLRKSLTDSIKTLPDLKGKKVAILGGNGTTGAYYMSLKLKEANLTLKDIQIVNLSAADQVTAIASGAIDATLASAPFTTRMIQDGTAVVFGGPITPGISGTAIMYGPNFAKKPIRPRSL